MARTHHHRFEEVMKLNRSWSLFRDKETGHLLPLLTEPWLCPMHFLPLITHHFLAHNGGTTCFLDIYAKCTLCGYMAWFGIGIPCDIAKKLSESPYSSVYGMSKIIPNIMEFYKEVFGYFKKDDIERVKERLKEIGYW